MANALYGKGKEKFATAGIDWSTATIKAALVKSAYSVNLATHEFHSDLGANILNTPQTLGSKTYTLGVMDAADITYTTVTAGDTASAVILYKDTGTSGTSPLIAYIDTITGFPLSTNGGDITIQWDNGSSKIWSF